MQVCECVGYADNQISDKPCQPRGADKGIFFDDLSLDCLRRPGAAERQRDRLRAAQQRSGKHSEKRFTPNWKKTYPCQGEFRMIFGQRERRRERLTRNSEQRSLFSSPLSPAGPSGSSCCAGVFGLGQAWCYGIEVGKNFGIAQAMHLS